LEENVVADSVNVFCVYEQPIHVEETSSNWGKAGKVRLGEL